LAVPRVVLAPGREGPFLGGHPWVFSGAIASMSPTPADGDEVTVVTSRGDFVGQGLFNGRSQIRVRLYAWRPRALDDAFFAERIADAVRLRRDVLGLGAAEGAARLVFSEGDGLSGLTVDRYGSYLAVQFTSLALATRREALLDALESAVSLTGVVLRTEKGILEEEGLELRDGPVRGTLPEGPLEIVDGGLRFQVDLNTGQKTGFYLDQRENRTCAARYADGRTVADVCCYTGGFGIAAATAGARSVTAVDGSAPALELARANAALNGVDAVMDFQRSDAFKWLEAQAAEGRRYGMIVLDPPRFARSRKGVPSALQAYDRLNGLAMACLEPDGILVTCSCSGRVSMEEFSGAVGRASARVGRAVQILERRGQAADHPVSATCLESAYLKCLVARVV
jgi:23S rRNA (cytosine1962-C5)-methyltransferase